MKNLSKLAHTQTAMRNKWDMHHPNGKLTVIGQANKGTPTSLSKKLDRALIRQLVSYSKFMLALPYIDFSKK